MTSASVSAALRRLASKEKARTLQRFFKTGPGDYGAGDQFLGVVVPDVRRVVRANCNLPRTELLSLLRSPIHEERLTALLILVEQTRDASPELRKNTAAFYMEHMAYINNWDLVDLSAYKIIGEWLLGGTEAGAKRTLIPFARSKNLWERRIAVLTTFAFIKRDRLTLPLDIADRLLRDKHDLIHKAVGWMLREVGKRNQRIEEAFLRPRYKKMPRTMLRYAIERFPEALRKKYLAGKI